MNGQNSNDDSQIDQARSNKGSKTHGTSMFSLIGGYSLGVMPYGIKPIIVRVPRRAETGGGATNEDWIEGLSKIYDDLDGYSTDAKAVLLMAQHHKRAFFARPPTDDADLEDGETKAFYTEGFTKRMSALIAELVRKGVVPVTGSGNDSAVSHYSVPTQLSSRCNEAELTRPRERSMPPLPHLP